MPVLLWTDILYFLLLAVAAIFAVYASKHEHLRVPWRAVARNHLGMGAAVFLSAYLVVGTLDSMHFYPSVGSGEDGKKRYGSEIASVLDMVLQPITDRTEKTYSAPFAIYSYAKETVLREDGSQSREFPRLRYAGSHLTDDSDRAMDIALTSVKALVTGLMVWLVLCVACGIILCRYWRCAFREGLKRIVSGRTGIPWSTVLSAAAILLVLVCLAASLGVKYHIFGTDKVGQDVFVQAVKSIRTGLMIGTLTTLVMLPFAVLLGIMAGYFGGWVDDVIQYLYTTLSSIPGVLLIAAAILLLDVYMAKHAEEFTSLATRADLRLLFLCMILGVTSWTGLCRLLRGEALKLRVIDYVQASKAFGVRDWNILLKHLLPNVMHIIMISVVLDFSGLVLAEAVLSYINIGVDPSMQSWGNMINSARMEMAREPIVWWSLLGAFLFMFTLVLAANLFSDTVRDAFDPRLREIRAV
jgi:peptide/nickel transport system permease protein